MPVQEQYARSRTDAAIRTEVLETTRHGGIEPLDTVRLAVLEITGRISFIQHDLNQPHSPPPHLPG